MEQEILQSNNNFSPELEPENETPYAEKWYKKNWGLGIIIMAGLVLILVVALISLVFLILQQVRKNTAILPTVTESSIEENKAIRQLLEDKSRPYLGNPDAKFVIVEFADFKCPICARQFPIIREAVNNHKDEVLFIFRQFPVTDEQSLTISQGALCAHEQEKFWAFHDQLFLNDEELTLEKIQELAGKIGLDSKKFNSCLENSEKWLLTIEDAQLGLNIGAVGTPTFFVNGNKAEGFISLQKWEEIIAKSLEVLNK